MPVSRAPGADIYDDSQFDSKLRACARKRINKYAEGLEETSLSFSALNVNDEAFKGSGTTAEEMLLSRNWRVFHGFFRI